MVRLAEFFRGIGSNDAAGAGNAGQFNRVGKKIVDRIPRLVNDRDVDWSGKVAGNVRSADFNCVLTFL